jgi:hypothetical protein
MRRPGSSPGRTPSPSGAAGPSSPGFRCRITTDNLGALELTLTGDALRRLDAAAGFTLGFPTDFIAEIAAGVYGQAASSLDLR